MNAMRYGGSRWFHWPIRWIVLAVIVAAGFLPYKYEIGGPCRIRANKEAALRSQLEDEIEQIYVDDGEMVEPGQLVAKLVARNERAELVVAQADVAYAEAHLKQVTTGPRPEDIAKAESEVARLKSQVTYWTAEHLRLEKLSSDNAASVTALQKALASRDSDMASLAGAEQELGKLNAGYREETVDEAEARLARAKAQLALQMEKLPLREIHSPIGGRISTRGVQLRVGQSVLVGDLVAVVRDPKSLELEMQADEAAAEEVRVGMPVKIRLRSLYGAYRTGKVTWVDVEASDEVAMSVDAYRSDRETRQEELRFTDTDDRCVRILVAFDEIDPDLLPGMTGEARVVVANDCFWGALAKPVVRFFLVDVWSWLP